MALCGGQETPGDLPWPLSLKLLPDEDTRQQEDEVEKADRQRALAAAAAQGKGVRLCQAWFNYKGERKMLQWAGPKGGTRLLDTIRSTFRVGEEKLIYLSVASSRDIIDIDSALPETFEYQVRVEPEDSGPLNIVPCLINICTFNYASNGQKRLER
mmetsp:Transcript_25090/g.63343  ORF Transcript_25090/g.63343 Transcript_25090/m.63343 type:complete len:156 (+) Transcript_25090:25-492(+)